MWSSSLKNIYFTQSTYNWQCPLRPHLYFQTHVDLTHVKMEAPVMAMGTASPVTVQTAFMADSVVVL